MNLADVNERKINITLRNTILKAGLTQGELAERVKIPRHYVSMHIHGRYVFTISEQKRIANELNMAVAELFD
jgi:plasmid maintenance system antidote protein VapI